jgi:integrase
MPKAPKPYKYRGYFCTSVGGTQHQKLCPVEDGVEQAKYALARLIVQRADEPASEKPRKGLAATVAEAHDEYLDYIKAERSAKTYTHRIDMLRPFYKRFGHRKLRDLTLRDGLEYKTWLKERKPWRMGGKGKLRHGVGNHTVNYCIRAAKALFTWCAKESRRFLDRNPWQEVGLLTEQPRSRVVTDEEFAHLLAHCRHGNMIDGGGELREELFVLRHTGLRPGELLAMRWDYVDFVTHRITFPPEVIKTRSRRSVTILPAVEEVLAARKARSGSGYVFPGAGRDGDGKRAYANADKQYLVVDLSRRFRRLVRACVAKGLIQETKSGEKLVLYSLRHTRITELVSQTLPLKVVMEEAGHRRPDTTNRYTHLADEYRTEAVRAAASGAGSSPSAAG